MARIRSIHPDFPSDRKLAHVCREARLAFVNCVCIADDKGLFRAEPRQLLGQLFPHDTDVDGSQLEAWLSTLLELGVLRWRQTRDGARVGQIVNWPKRQKIDKPSRSFLDEELRPAEASRVAREPSSIEQRGAGEAPATPSPSGVLSLEPRALSLEPRAVGDRDEPAARVPRYGELRQKLSQEAQDALEGYVRAAQDPGALVATILAEGPDTGTNGAAGKTWQHIGQALLELRASSAPFRPVVFRTFVQRLVRERAGTSSDGEPDYKRMERLAQEERAREGQR